MFSKILSAAVCGIEGLPVWVEADVSEGLPGFAMVGDLSVKVKEAQERVTTAFRNTGIRLMPRRVTVNLSPADVRKDGTGYDLPIALAVLKAYGTLPSFGPQKVLVTGELGLNGAVKRIDGVLPIVYAARNLGCRFCVVPEENRAEGEMVKDITVVGVSSLEETIAFFQSGTVTQRERKPDFCEKETAVPDFSCVSGQKALRRAAEVAVAGRHNFLMSGPPGSGKSLIAKCLPGIFPPLTQEECLEVSAVYSVAGLLGSDRPLIRQRPFRSPHHTVSAQALIGGGRIPRPGEVSLAHKGVLFLDELPEFRTETLEALRQPLEERKVLIVRTSRSDIFPADCMVVAAMNNCRCGYFPDMQRCTCTEREIRRYQQRISQPLLDRMDISVTAGRVTYEELSVTGKSECSGDIRERVIQAFARQEERYRGTAFSCNAQLTPDGVREYCALTEEEKRLLCEAYRKFELTARGCHRILKVARTIADLEQSEQIQTSHLCEAIGYRVSGRRTQTL